VNNNQDPPQETAIVLCHACGSPIHLADQAASQESMGNFVRLRCMNPQCGHTEWYEESDFERDPTTTDPQAENGGEVWVHDLLLGLTFRAHNGKM